MSEKEKERKQEMSLFKEAMDFLTDDGHKETIGQVCENCNVIYEDCVLKRLKAYLGWVHEKREGWKQFFNSSCHYCGRFCGEINEKFYYNDHKMVCEDCLKERLYDDWGEDNNLEEIIKSVRRFHNDYELFMESLISIQCPKCENHTYRDRKTIPDMHLCVFCGAFQEVDKEGAVISYAENEDVYHEGKITVVAKEVF